MQWLDRNKVSLTSQLLNHKGKQRPSTSLPHVPHWNPIIRAWSSSPSIISSSVRSSTSNMPTSSLVWVHLDDWLYLNCRMMVKPNGRTMVSCATALQPPRQLRKDCSVTTSTFWVWPSGAAIWRHHEINVWQQSILQDFHANIDLPDNGFGLFDRLTENLQGCWWHNL